MRLLFVNRFYWPETPATGQLLTDLAEGLAARGHEVNVITSGAAGAPRAEARRGVRILRIRGTRLSRAGVGGKAVDFATFYLGALFQVLRVARAGTIVVPMTDPPLLGIGAWIGARLRGARVVHWAQDIYPEIAMALSGQRWLGVLRPPRNLAWRRADRCVAVGNDMAAVLLAAGVAPRRVAVIPNWALGGAAAPAADAVAGLRRAWGLDGRFVLAYSGNLGRVHDLEPVLTLAEALRDDPTIAIVFIGDGAQRAALQSGAANRQLAHVRFLPAQPREQLAVTLALADAHLVTLRAGCEQLVFPSKLYGVAAIGRPVLFIGPRDCEVARIVKEHRLGHAATRDELAAAANFVRGLASDPAARLRAAAAARAFAAEHTSERALERWSALLAEVEACPERARAATTHAT